MTKLGCCFYHHQDQSYEKIINNFDLIVPEIAFKWNCITNSNLISDFTLADNFVDFAKKNYKEIIGNVLFFLPYSAIPKWFITNLPVYDQVSFIKNYIAQIILRYPCINVWEIIGEIVDDNGRFRDSNPIIKSQGIGFIKELFCLAKYLSPNSTLLISEYRVQSDKKWSSFWSVIDGLLLEKTPIDGISIQLHHHAKTLPYVPYYLEKRCKEAQERGLRINISEVSLFVHNNIPDNVAYQIQNAYFKKIALIAKKYDAISMTVWGATDKYGWRYDNFSDRPYLFDRDYHPKQAFYTVKNILANY